MKLKQLKSSNATKAMPMDVLDKDTGQPIEGATIWLYGPHSDVYRQTQMAQQRRLNDRAVKARGKIHYSPEQQRADRLELAINCTSDWTFEDDSGKKIPVTKESVKEVYEDPELQHIYEQVLEFHTDTRNF